MITSETGLHVKKAGLLAYKSDFFCRSGTGDRAVFRTIFLIGDYKREHCKKSVLMNTVHAQTHTRAQCIKHTIHAHLCFVHQIRRII